MHTGTDLARLVECVSGVQSPWFDPITKALGLTPSLYKGSWCAFVMSALEGGGQEGLCNIEFKASENTRSCLKQATNNK